MKAKEILKERIESEDRRTSLSFSQGTDSLGVLINFNHLEVPNAAYENYRDFLSNTFKELKEKGYSKEEINEITEEIYSYYDDLIGLESEENKKYEERLGNIAISFEKFIRSVLLEISQEKTEIVNKKIDEFKQKLQNL